MHGMNGARFEPLIDDPHLATNLHLPEVCERVPIRRLVLEHRDEDPGRLVVAFRFEMRPAEVERGANVERLAMGGNRRLGGRQPTA